MQDRVNLEVGLFATCVYLGGNLQLFASPFGLGWLIFNNCEDNTLFTFGYRFERPHTDQFLTADSRIQTTIALRSKMSTRFNFAKNCIGNAVLVVKRRKRLVCPLLCGHMNVYDLSLNYHLRQTRDGDGFTAKERLNFLQFRGTIFFPLILNKGSYLILSIEIGTSIQINRIHLFGTKILSFNS